jgi:hypothetical protein
MLPTSSHCNLRDVLLGYAVLLRQNSPAILAMVWNVFSTNLCDHFLRKNALTFLLSLGNSAPSNHISDVVQLGSFKNVARIETRRIVARMPPGRHRPMSVGQIKCQSVNEPGTPTEANYSIIIHIAAKRPHQAFIRIVRSKKFEKACVASARLIKHLRSFAAMVGRVRFHERLAFCYCTT